MPILGIDLGTTNSLAAIYREGASVLIPNAYQEYLTPSVVSIEEDGTVLVGKIAKERLISHPQLTAAQFKRFMGTSKKYSLGGKNFTPEELSSFVLRKLKEDAEAFLGEEIKEAVISVPAYFSDSQRAATKRAGELAGLLVERLVNEPSAAALAFRMQDSQEDEGFLVFDFGGGTLDVSVVDCFDNVVSIVAICGDNHLGGADFDQAIAEHFCKENNLEFFKLPESKQASLLRKAELCKIALTSQDSVMMAYKDESYFGTVVLNNQLLIEIAAPLFQRILNPVKRAIFDSQMDLQELAGIIFVGGSCKMPVIQQYLYHSLKLRAENQEASDRIVALGVGIYAGMKERQENIKDMLLTDICPFTLGIGVHNYANPANLLMSPIIERNSVLPSSKVHRFYTTHDWQKEVDVAIFQGEAMYCFDNVKLGQMKIKVPSAPKGKESIDVRFTYDINGILEVEISNESTGDKQKLLLLGKNAGLTEEMVEKRMQELQKLKIHPKEEEENRLVIAHGQRLYEETLGETRNEVLAVVNWFEQVLEKQEARLIERARKQVEEYLTKIEGGNHFSGPFYFRSDEEE